MEYKKLLQHLESMILPYLNEEQVIADFKSYLGRVQRALRASEFKLKRTIQDKQITTNVLENTISELKKQSESLKKQKVLTEEQSAFKEQLFANVSHELRTPLHGILGMSHLLEQTQLDEAQSKYVDIIRGSGDNLLVIINDLLNLSKINAGKTVLQEEPFSTVKFLNDLNGIIAFKAQEKGLSFKIIQEQQLPPYIIGDRTRLYQILLNLLNNAIKYTDKGFVSLSLICQQLSDEKVELTFLVKDSGIGIAPKDLSSIFDSFTQLEVNNGKVYEGVGLGLNIVKNLLKLMNGNVAVESSPEGTIFTVNISFGLPEQGFKDTSINGKQLATIPKEWAKKKILLIEDNEANLVFAKHLFENSPLNLEIAEALEIATKKIHQIKFDCILSDVKLPDGNGLDFIAELRANNSNLNQNTPIIILTASANEIEANQAQKLNVHNYIGKPFPPKILISSLKVLFEESSFQTANPVLTINSNNSINDYFLTLDKNFKNKSKLKVEMMDIFLQQLPLAIRQMEKGLSEDDLKVFHYDAHRIKSTINIIGLPKLIPLITKMDEYCYRKINLDQLPLLLKQFKSQAKEDVQIINARKEELSVMC